MTSTVGKGTTVRIAFPPHVGDPLAKPRARDSRPSIEVRPNVVVVESNSRARPAYARLLADGRARVTFASPEEALRRLALGEPIDVVLVDRDLRPETARAFHRELGRVSSDIRTRTLDVSLRALRSERDDDLDDDDHDRATSSWSMVRGAH